MVQLNMYDTRVHTTVEVLLWKNFSVATRFMSITSLTDNRMNAANAAIKCALSLNGIDSFNKVRRGMVKRLIRKNQWLDTSINSQQNKGIFLNYISYEEIDDGFSYID